jgi:hypothetical protein
MPEFIYPNFAKTFDDAAERGFQRSQRSKLSDLMTRAYSAPQEQQGGFLAKIAGIDPRAAQGLEGQFLKRQESQQEAAIGIARAWKSTAGATPEQRQALYNSTLLPRAQAAGLPIPQTYDPAAFDREADALIAMGGGGQGLGVQSTYVDAQGNRIAIMRDGTTAVLGQNAPNNQIIDTGNGFYGVNKGSLSAAPVTIGGAPQASAPAPNIAPGNYQTPAGMVRVGDLTPDEQQAMLADIQAGGNATNVQLPQRDVGQQQFGGQQLRSAPKPDGAYTTLSPQEVQSLGLPQGTVAQRSPSGQVQIVNKPRDLPTGGQVIDNGDGTTTFIPAGKITEGERNAAGFYQRMVTANEEMKRLTGAGYDPTNLRDFMTVGSTLGNFAASPNGQQFHQAAMNWVRANLRKESGAAIGVDEARQEIRNYFPMPGDSPQVIAQKARNRETVERAMRTAAGGALPPPTNSQKASKPAAPAGWSIQRVQ